MAKPNRLSMEIVYFYVFEFYTEIHWTDRDRTYAKKTEKTMKE